MQAVYSQNSFRVKVYKLNPEGNWDDKGTGLVSAETMEVRAPARRPCRAPLGAGRADRRPPRVGPRRGRRRARPRAHRRRPPSRC